MQGLLIEPVTIIDHNRGALSPFKNQQSYDLRRAVHFEAETEGLNLQCLADFFRLEQVFRNLFENALAACSDPFRNAIAVVGSAAWRTTGPAGGGARQRTRPLTGSEAETF